MIAVAAPMAATIASDIAIVKMLVMAAWATVFRNSLTSRTPRPQTLPRAESDSDGQSGANNT